MVKEFLEQLTQIVGSKSALADALGVSPSTLSQWLKRESIPLYGLRLIALSTRFDISWWKLSSKDQSCASVTEWTKARARQVENERVYYATRMVLKSSALRGAYRDKLNKESKNV